MTSSGTSIPSDSTTEPPSSDSGSDTDEVVASRDGQPDASSETEKSVFDTIDRWIPEDQCGLPSDVVFDILKNERRRLVLQYLRETESPAKLGNLAEHIAAFENDVSPTGLNAQQRKRVYIGLYQCHLPKMADAGVVEFDQDRGTVEMNESGESLLTFLDIDDEPDHSATPFLLVLGGGVLAFTLSRLFLPLWTSDLVFFVLLTSVMALVVTRASDS